nr:hypothetical protein BaRGS_009910 [Batillaria attramentaria]
MFILSTLDYNDYLNKPCYAEAAKTLPKPADVPGHQKGDFDLLVIHRRHGVLIGEIKTVGSEDPADATVAQKIYDAYKQLNKSEVVVRHILSDLKLDLPVRKTLILPHITKDRLKRVLENNFNLKKAVSACVGVDETDPARALDKTLGMCLCGDDMSDPETPWLVDKDVLSKLTDWWQNRMATTQAPPLQKGLYLHVISSVFGHRYLKLITDLRALDSHLCFWAATFYHDIIPPGMQSEALTCGVEVGRLLQEKLRVGDTSLERKVVVWLPGRASNDFDPTRAGDLWREKERDKLKDKLAGFSRCSTQLVLVEVPDDM